MPTGVRSLIHRPFQRNEKVTPEMQKALKDALAAVDAATMDADADDVDAEVDVEPAPGA